MPRARSATASATSAPIVGSIADPGPLEDEQQPTTPPPRKRASGKGRARSVAVDKDALGDICKLSVGALSYVLGLVAAAPDMALASDLSMTKEEAEQIGIPLANILSSTALVKRYAAAINNGNDYVQLAGGLFDYGTRFTAVYLERHPIRARKVSPPPQQYSPSGASGEPTANYSNVPAHLLAS